MASLMTGLCDQGAVAHVRVVVSVGSHGGQREALSRPNNNTVSTEEVIVDVGALKSCGVWLWQQLLLLLPWVESGSCCCYCYYYCEPDMTPAPSTALRLM